MSLTRLAATGCLSRNAWHELKHNAVRTSAGHFMSLMSITKRAGRGRAGATAMIGTLSAAFLAVAQPAFAQQTNAGPPQKQAGKSPVKVFILAGQSNMEGQGCADLEGKDYNEGKGTLNYLMKDPAKAPLLQTSQGQQRPMDGPRRCLGLV